MDLLAHVGKKKGRKVYPNQKTKISIETGEKGSKNCSKTRLITEPYKSNQEKKKENSERWKWTKWKRKKGNQGASLLNVLNHESEANRQHPWRCSRKEEKVNLDCHKERVCFWQEEIRQFQWSKRRNQSLPKSPARQPDKPFGQNHEVGQPTTKKRKGRIFGRSKHGHWIKHNWHKKWKSEAYAW